MTAASEWPTRWWAEPFRLLQTNLREEDALLDASASVAQLLRLGYDTWLCNAGGIIYFYPVQESFQRRAAQLGERPSGDMVRDVLDAAHERGVRLLSRFDFSRLPHDVIEGNPHWAFVGNDDTWYTEDGLTAICPRSDYHEVIVPQVLTDFVTKYEVDGIFFNWLQYPEVAYSSRYKGPCQCERCKTAFQQAYPGVSHPRTPSDAGYEQWTALAQQHLSYLAHRYSRLINDVRPGTPLMLADVRMDIAFLETNSALGHEPGKWWLHTPSEMASVNRTSDPGVPALVHSSVNMGLPYRQVAEEPTQFRQYIAQALSRGALASTVVIGTVDEDRFPAFAAAAPLLTFASRRQEMYAKYNSASPIALVRPRGGTAMSAMQSSDDFSEFRGWYAALQEAHLPFDVLGLQFQDKLVDADVLSRYRLLILPGTTGMNERLRGAVDAFVVAGGSLVVSGDAYVDRGRPTLSALPALGLHRRLTGLADLGGRYVGPADGRVDTPLHPVLGHFDLPTWRKGATPGDLALSTQTPFGPPEVTGGNVADPSAPALAHSIFGAGKVTYLPWSIGQSAHESGLTALTAIMVEQIRRLVPDVYITADLPAQVELTIGRSANRWVVHLVNHSGGRGDRVRAPLAVTGDLILSPTVAATVTTARTLVEPSECLVHPQPDGSGRVQVTVSDVLEVIVLA